MELIFRRISSGLQTAAVLAEAFSIGWAIGTQIKKGLDDIGWGQWIDDKVNKLMEVVNAAERAKTIDTESKANSQKILARLKKSGIDWLSLGDVETANEAYRNANSIYELLVKYPQLAKSGYNAKYLANLKAYDPEKYARLQRGDLSAVGIKTATPTTNKPTINSPTDAAEYYKRQQQNWKNNASFYQPGASVATSVNTVLNSNIYLDTGALVGGTSRTSAVQQNYTARGYAT